MTSNIFLPTAIFLLLSLPIILLAVEQIRQCACNEQQKCFDSMKEEVTECIDECVDRAGLEKSIIDATSQMATCLDQRKQMISMFFDCLNNQLTMEGSCESIPTDKKVEYSDFEGIFLSQMRTMVENIQRQMEGAYADLQAQIPFIQNGLDLQKCSQECGLKKVHNLYCFTGLRCTLSLPSSSTPSTAANKEEFAVKRAMRQCLAQMDLAQRLQAECKCYEATITTNSTSNGDGQMVAKYCERIGQQQQQFGGEEMSEGQLAS